MENIFKKMHDEGQQNEAEILQKIWDKVSNLSGTNNSVVTDNRLVDMNLRLTYKVSIKDGAKLDDFVRNLYVKLIRLKKHRFIYQSEHECKIELCLLDSKDDTLESIDNIISKIGKECDVCVSLEKAYSY